MTRGTEPAVAASANRRARPTVAFATHGGMPAGPEDDALIRAPLAGRERVDVESIPWDAPNVDWGRFAAVILRSTWDSHVRPAEFLAWTERVRAAGVPLLNPAPVVRWNLDKGYLRDLERAGVPVVPTERIPRGSVPDLAGAMRRRGWEAAVVKPSVGASGFRTWVARGDGAAEHRAELAALLEEADALVQPLLPEVMRGGEWSFVFFGDGERPEESAGGGFAGGGPSAPVLGFSHAVVKRPAPGDFRVQDEFGGTVEAATAPEPLRRQAERVAAVVAQLAPGPLLYARIDGVASDGVHAPPGTFLLMEAELIEPFLFLGTSKPAPARFARAIAARLRPVPEPCVP